MQPAPEHELEGEEPSDTLRPATPPSDSAAQDQPDDEPEKVDFEFMLARLHLLPSYRPEKIEVMFSEAYKRFGLAPVRAAWLRLALPCGAAQFDDFAVLLNIPFSEFETLMLPIKVDRRLAAQHNQMCFTCARVKATLLCTECEELTTTIEESISDAELELDALMNHLGDLMSWLNKGLVPPAIPLPPGYDGPEPPVLHPSRSPDLRQIRPAVILRRLALWAEAGLTPPEILPPPGYYDYD
ncbi:unnamed protein product [Tilletia laevis]|uniref:Uncharacterized protein n=2 Tax=Tilletia TaxID=13289 RepID=A0A177VHB4_9BASI|nr:hypothetical protein CF336_g2229 [Tilletia laevis]KAE8263431.1 hypothetical protein A4X03_0g1683 [Tilletia caries]CAD6905887.1 unnamed protein product [Tilletia controversa]KAE8206897.1 hypothetical protein CF335_g1543 [Tilletia laevis]CAD6893278.1 unnamed protein product [Tilletia caries]